MNQLAQALTLPGGTATNGTWNDGTTTLIGPATGITSLGVLISRSIPYIILFAAVALLIMILGSGFPLLTGANDPKQLEMGKKRLTMSVAGFFIVFLSFWAVQIAGVIFGINEFTCVFGPFGGLTCPQ